MGLLRFLWLFPLLDLLFSPLLLESAIAAGTQGWMLP